MKLNQKSYLEDEKHEEIVLKPAKLNPPNQQSTDSRSQKSKSFKLIDSDDDDDDDDKEYDAKLAFESKLNLNEKQANQVWIISILLI